MNKYIVYSDGSCKGTTVKHGGWAAIICDNQEQIVNEIYGSLNNTTSQRMELRAAIEGLKAIKEPSEIKIISDSQYLVSTINDNWLPRILEGSGNFANIDLWEKMARLLEYHNVSLRWTKGHADNKMNNRADKLAQFAATVLNAPDDEYINNGKESREPLVSELEAWRSDGSYTGQKNGEVLYSLG